MEYGIHWLAKNWLNKRKSGDDGGVKIKKRNNRGTKLPDRRHTVFSWIEAIIDSISFRNCVRIAHILTQRSAPFSFCSHFRFFLLRIVVMVCLQWAKMEEEEKMRRQRSPVNTTETDCRRRSSSWTKNTLKFLNLFCTHSHFAYTYFCSFVRSATGVVSSLRLLCFSRFKKKCAELTRERVHRSFYFRFHSMAKIAKFVFFSQAF